MKTAEEWLRDYAKLNRDLPINDFVIGFAKYYAKAKLEEAAENAKVKKMDLNKWIDIKDLPEHPYIVDKQSILNTPLD